MQPLPPPAVLILPTHVRMQDWVPAMGQSVFQQGQKTLLLREIGMPGYIPGDDLLGGRVVDGSEIRLGAFNSLHALECGDCVLWWGKSLA